MKMVIAIINKTFISLNCVVQTMVLENTKSIVSIIRKDQLPEELGGTLVYNHQTWLQFIQVTMGGGGGAVP